MKDTEKPRNIFEVIEDMLQHVPDENPLTGWLARVRQDAGFTAPESMHTRWEDTRRVLVEAIPNPRLAWERAVIAIFRGEPHERITAILDDEDDEEETPEQLDIGDEVVVRARVTDMRYSGNDGRDPLAILALDEGGETMLAMHTDDPRIYSLPLPSSDYKRKAEERMAAQEKMIESLHAALVNLDKHVREDKLTKTKGMQAKRRAILAATSGVLDRHKAFTRSS